MIDYTTYCEIQRLHKEGLSARQIALELKLGRRTVRQWLKRKQFKQRSLSVPRPSKLDRWKGEIVRLLNLHPYTAQQIFQQLQPRGYEGSYSILKRFVRQVRPKPVNRFPEPCSLPRESALRSTGVRLA